MNVHNFNLGAQNSKHDIHTPQGSCKPPQVSAPSSPYLEARLLNLEASYADLHGEVHALKDLYHALCTSFGTIGQTGQAIHASFLKDTDLTESRQSAIRFQQELEQLSLETRLSLDSNADEVKANGRSTPNVKNSFLPNVRNASVDSRGSGQRSLPPHLRGGKQAGTVNGNLTPAFPVDTTMHRHEPLITDGHVDTIVRQTAVPAIALSPPLSVTTTVQDDASPKKIEVLSLNGWKPYYLTTLSSLPFGIRHKIPARKDMATFSFDMLQNTFGGIAWSPGLRYIKMSSAPVLRNRTYYMLDPANEPYLPQIPGEHGAKLTAFFNKAPEEEFDNLPKGTNSYTNVPMFVRVSGGRYVYFGDYSQTRWSDKLDNDTMRTRVPQRVKEYLAKELTATPREDWVTRELKKHFFPKPEYEGNILIPTSDDATISTVNEEKHSKQIAIDIKEYVGELAEWEREANMKTAMMKPDFILNAFDAADADDPPALRLWWEYLECVDWKPDFYNMLVGFQARTDNLN